MLVEITMNKNWSPRSVLLTRSYDSLIIDYTLYNVSFQHKHKRHTESRNGELDNDYVELDLLLNI